MHRPTVFISLCAAAILTLAAVVGCGPALPSAVGDATTGAVGNATTGDTVTDMDAGPFNVSMRLPRTIGARVSANATVTLLNISDATATVQPSSWALVITGVTLRVASTHFADAWRGREGQSVSLSPGASLDMTFPISVSEPAEYRVAPTGGPRLGEMSASLTVE